MISQHSNENSRLLDWVGQFPYEDREFLLKEVQILLSKRFYSPSRIESDLQKLLQTVAFNNNFLSISKFLENATLLNLQAPLKSQPALLKIIANNPHVFGPVSLGRGPSGTERYFIYIDDFLFTGATFYNNLMFFLKSNNCSFYDLYKNNVKVIVLYLAVHELGLNRIKECISIQSGIELSKFLEFKYLQIIENDFRVKESKLDFIFPKKSTINNEIIAFMGKVNGKLFYRGENLPNNELFFSCNKSRDRFEKIILEKSFELFLKDRLRFKDRNRPLGCGLLNDSILGFGGFSMTYRNVPLTLPLVFLYRDSEWTPLFQRRDTSAGKN